MGKTFKKILLVDDDDAVRELFGEVLHQAGYESVRARSGSEALKLFDEVSPDLVISDVIMADGDGKQLLINIRKKSPDFPVIMMTGYSGGVLQELQKAGANAILSKPFSFKLLMETIQKIA